MSFIEILKNYYPDVDAGLNKKAAGELGGSLQKYQADLPAGFLNLYQHYDGENQTSPGIFAGFSWMSNADIIQTQALLEEASSTEKYSNLPDQIQQINYADYWIPFAHDHGGSYLAIDIKPGANGNKGQVISLDRNSDEIYVIANSFDEFCRFIFESLANEKITLIREDDESVVFCWHSGHLFNDLNALHVPANTTTIQLTGYWREYFKNKAKDNQIAVSELEKLGQLVVNDRNTAYKGPISFEILQYCSNLTELICHSNSVVSFEQLKYLSKLKKFYAKSTSFTEKSLDALSSCLSLKDIGLISMDLDSLQKLAGLPIKTLALVNTQIKDIESVLVLKDLSELRIEGLNAAYYDFIGELKGLKKLDLKKISIINVDFLKTMKLTDFNVNNIPVDNQHDGLVANMASLKETDWPFSDLSLLATNTKLNSIGVNADKLSSIEAIKDTNISAVTVVNASSEQQAQSIIDRINQFKKLSSYGWQVNWEN